MFKSFPRCRQLLAFALILPLAVACGDPDPEPDPDALPEAREMETERAPEQRMDTTVDLHPVNDSGVQGTAEIMHGDGQAVVVIEVEGLPGEGGYAAHIHRGTCADGGPVAAPLDPVVGLADGTGSSNTTVDTTEIDHDQRHFIQVHGEGGTPIACGDVEGH